MRLWTLHLSYLDARGLVALWREGLLARKVLEGNTKGYTNHPQLLRFKQTQDPLKSMDVYLDAVIQEAKTRGYNFDVSKIRCGEKAERIPVAEGQLEHEMKHLKTMLAMRDPVRLEQIEKVEKQKSKIRVHPLFKVTKGTVEPWEKITDNINSFPYSLDFKKIDFREHPELYKVGMESKAYYWWNLTNLRSCHIGASRLLKLPSLLLKKFTYFSALTKSKMILWACTWYANIFRWDTRVQGGTRIIVRVENTMRKEQ